MNNRRTFLRKIALGSALVSLFVVPKNLLAKNDPIKNVLLHHVFFWMKNTNSQEDRQQFEKAIAELLKVETIRQSHFGKPAATESRDVVDHSYSYSMLLIFNSKEEQDSYQVHPLHKKFVEENNHLWERVVVYDSTDLTFGKEPK